MGYLRRASRTSSTKTRIETNQLHPLCRCPHRHQEQVPRKQGLKHLPALEPAPWMEHQEQVPRKQGLKQLHRHASNHSHQHQEQVPRKQGLKHTVFGSHASGATHQEQVPRKQGLKQDYYMNILLRKALHVKSVLQI